MQKSKLETFTFVTCKAPVKDNLQCFVPVMLPVKTKNTFQLKKVN